MYLNLIFASNCSFDAFGVVFASADIDGKVLKKTIEQVRWAQVRRVGEVVSAFGVFSEPGTLVGSVVQHNVADTQYLRRREQVALHYNC